MNENEKEHKNGARNGNGTTAGSEQRLGELRIVGKKRQKRDKSSDAKEENPAGNTDAAAAAAGASAAQRMRPKLLFIESLSRGRPL